MSALTSLLTTDTPTASGIAAGPDLAELTGRILCEGRFLVETLLGRGAQGAVFRVQRCGPDATAECLDTRAQLDRYVPRPLRTPEHAAMKVLFPDPNHPQLTERFLAEYRIAARLRAGSFVCGYELFEEGELLFYTMDLMPGGSLASAIGTPLPVAVAVGLTLDVLEGLDELHSLGIVHRDIKHHNILLDAPLPIGVAGDRPILLPRAKLGDFGISDVKDMVFGDRVFESQTGTPYFMAPEFGKRDTVDARVDLYAVGVLLFMLLTGLHPRSRSTSRGSTALAVQRQLAGEAIQPLHMQELAQHIPEEVAQVVSELLEPDPNRRLRTAALAFDALYAWFAAHKDHHYVQLSHSHNLRGKPYLAAAAFAGRQVELAQADSFLRMQLTGDTSASVPAASALVLAGEPGMGKSRLTQCIRRKASGLGFSLHTLVAQRGQGAFAAIERLQQHFHDLYKEAIEQASPEEKADGQDPHHRTYVPNRERDSAYILLRQVEIKPEERSAYHELLEHYLLDRFAAEVRFASYQTPQCFLIEDAQWLDAGTIKYLFWCMRFLSSSKARGMPVRVAWVMNSRPMDPEGDAVLQLEAQLEVLARMEETPQRIELLGFANPDACEMVASMLQLTTEAPVVKSLVAALEQHRTLLPLYVEQSVWTLFTSGNLATAEPGKRWDGQWKLASANLVGSLLPSSVREAIGNRASRLSAETLRILGVAAVAGKEFDVEVICRAAELDAESVLTALEQAGAAGFVLQEQGQSRQYLADKPEGDIRFRFSHDRYRESIFGKLDSAAKRAIHGQLAQAILQRWGEGPDTHPLLAEHYFGAEDYASAYMNAKKVAEEAHRTGNHERAAHYFHLALDSHRLAQPRLAADTALQKLRDRAAESMAAVGRFDEANAQLRTLLEDMEVPKQKQLDCQRRIAESYYIQQDFQNATEQFTQLLLLLGVDVKEKGWKKALTLLRGSFALLVRGPFGAGFNRRQADNPSEEAMIIQTLHLLSECSSFIDYRIGLSVAVHLAHRLTTRGVHPYSASIMALFSYIFASQGMSAFSMRYERQMSELFPELWQYEGQDSNIASRTPLSLQGEQNSHEAYARTFLLLSGAYLYQGCMLNRPKITYYLRQAICAADRAANIQLMNSTRGFNYGYCLFTGRISSFKAQTDSCINIFRRTHITKLDRFATFFQRAMFHEIAGNLDQAARDYQEAAKVSQEYNAHLWSFWMAGSKMLCLALGEPVPPQSLTQEAITSAHEWLQSKMSLCLVFCLACFMAAAAVTLARHQVSNIPQDFLRMMRRARRQAMAEHQQRPIYLAAEATLCWMQGRCSLALAQFAEASTSATKEGYLYQLLLVLRIAVRILPKSHTAHDYYRQWLSQLHQNLNDQPTVKLRDVEDAVFPPMPSAGKPADLPPCGGRA